MTNLKLEKIEIYQDEILMNKTVHLYIVDQYVKPKVMPISYDGDPLAEFDYETVDEVRHIIVPISHESLYNFGNDYATIIKRSLELGNWLSAPQIERLYDILLKMQAESKLLEGAQGKSYTLVNGVSNFEPKSQRDPGVDKLPGLKEIVKHPANPEYNWAGGDMKGYGTLEKVIIDLNDREKWTVNQIADWLDSIHDPTGQDGPNLRLGQQESKIDTDDDEWKSVGLIVGPPPNQLSFSELMAISKYPAITVGEMKKILKEIENEQD